MQYAILYHETPGEVGKRGTDEAPGYWAAWTEYMDMIRASGALVGGNALEPPNTATIVRAGTVQDGPFPETREELGGFVIVEAAHLDAAIKIAEGAPCAKPGRGHVEVRPVLMPSVQDA